MSTAANHVKRSHRSQYRARAFQGGQRSVIKPTVSRGAFMEVMQILAKFIRNRFAKREVKSDAVHP